MKECEECYSINNRSTPILNPRDCLENHMQYICGTCGRCICVNRTEKSGLQSCICVVQIFVQKQIAESMKSKMKKDDIPIRFLIAPPLQPLIPTTIRYVSMRNLYIKERDLNDIQTLK